MISKYRLDQIFLESITNRHLSPGQKFNKMMEINRGILNIWIGAMKSSHPRMTEEEMIVELKRRISVVRDERL